MTGAARTMVGALAVLSFATLALAGCSRWRARAHDEVQVADVRFSHQFHLGQGLGCADCHDAVAQATSARPDLRPKKPECANCHDVVDTAKCGVCHRKPNSPAGWPEEPESELVFSHAAHLKRVESKCERCHPRAAASGRATDELSPPMAACLECHNHRREFSALDCRRCHTRLTELKPATYFAHEPDFLRRHGELARPTAQACAQCHDETFCGECHNRLEPERASIKYPEHIERQFVHRGDYVSRHFLEARADQTLCKRCHGATFCQACHQREGVGPVAHGTAPGQLPRSPHPRGEWMNATSPRSHGRAARTNPAECASCHDQGARSICVPCHRVGGLAGVSPHPPGWAGRVESRFGGRDEARNHRTCKVCHP